MNRINRERCGSLRFPTSAESDPGRTADGCQAGVRARPQGRRPRRPLWAFI